MSFLFMFIMIFIMVIIKTNYSTIKGSIGERKVKKTLEALNPTHYIQFHDLYIPIENGSKTSQIDHLIISPKGIFVIETKNYKGWITGSEKYQYWNQTNYKRKDKFKNPIWQNFGHIKALKNYLGDLVEDIPFYSIIVFGDQAVLKFKSEFKSADVIKRKNLLNIIKTKSDRIVLNHMSIKQIQQKLESVSNISMEQKKRISKNHKTEINATLAIQKKSITENVCPKCGNHLISRVGKFGSFKGCSNYPKCKFTA